jgi:hypothetical protein
VKVFFDNCTSPVLASTLDGFIRHRGHSAHHIRDLPCGAAAADVTWMAMVGENAEEWLVITGDLRVQRNKAERAAFRQMQLKGFALAPAYQRTPIEEVASILVRRWPKMEELMRLVAPPALYELPLSRSGRFRPLPL